MAALIDKYSKEELEQIVKNSFSMKEVIDKLGYATHSGSNHLTVKTRLEKYNIDISHFNSTINRTKRTEENIFVENSTANQTTLRRWYKKGEYTPYICSICGQEPIWQGKELTLILDHINGNNHDDRLENLRWVCPNCNQQLDTTNGKNIKNCKKKYCIDYNKITTKYDEYEYEKENIKKYYCVDCGKEISRTAIRCKKCEMKNRIIPLEKMVITREELKELIKTTSFTKIGEKFGVSDNAVRKWCDKFNLPRTKSEINSYSNEEWELL